MGDVSKTDGRTILLVSHNMTSIIRLCYKAILLNNGKITMHDKTSNVVDHYVKNNLDLGSSKSCEGLEKRPGNHIVQLLNVKAVDNAKQPNSKIDITEPNRNEKEKEVLEEGHVLWHGINFYTEDGVNIFDSHSVTSKWYYQKHPKGVYKTIAWLPGNLFNEGKIIINVAIFNHSQHQLHLHEKDVIAFEVADFLRDDNISSRGESVGRFPGSLRPLLQKKKKNMKKN